jgi:hypothetical protein
MAHLLGECSHRRPSLAHHLSLLNFVANQEALSAAVEVHAEEQVLGRRRLN